MTFKLPIIVFILSLMVVSSASFSQGNSQNTTDEKEKVAGVGGIFFRANDPAALSECYETHLVINHTPQSYDAEVWQQETGPTVFAPFPNDTEYFGRESQTWMIKFRVNDLDAMVNQLESAGIEVNLDEQEYPNGRFARLHDLEGNPIELWEPNSNE
jgi:predicted enzyme related to lactoylglutathione lyase